MTENQGSIPEREPEKRLPHPRKAAGAQITHCRLGEVVTKNNDAKLEGGLAIGMSTLLLTVNEYPLEGKSGAISRGNSSSNSVY